MIAFWTTTGIMIAAALAMVIPSLLRKPKAIDERDTRDALNLKLYHKRLAELEEDLKSGLIPQEQYEEGRHDIERALLNDTPATGGKQTMMDTKTQRWAALAASAILPALAVSLYLYLGAGPKGLETQQRAAHPTMNANAGTNETGQLPSVEEMVQKLADKLADDPENGPGWALLARSYIHIGRMEDARDAYVRAQTLGVSDEKIEALLEGAPTAQVNAQGATQVPHDNAAMLERLEERLAKNPEEYEGWAMLARSYYGTQRYDKAVAAFAKAGKGEFAKTDADFWADYADAYASANDKRVAGEAETFAAKALQINPNHVKALWLSATGAMQRQDREQALAQWRHLYTLLPPGSRDASMIAAAIAQLDPGAAPGAMDVAETPTPDTASTGATEIRGSVSVAPDMAGSVSAEDTVFVFARAANGPRMPLAVVRKKVKDLPFNFILDDSMAMMPAMKLSNFKDVVVSARVSKSGGATPQSGDLTSAGKPVNLANVQPVNLVINQLHE